jgi:hypothetical protein
MILKIVKSFVVNILLAVIGLLMIIIFSVSIYWWSVRISTNWVETTPVRLEIGKVQNRTRNKLPDYFFKIHFYYTAKGREYSIYTDPGYASREEAEKERADIHVMPKDLKLWYNESDPAKAVVNESETLSLPFLYRSGISLFILLFTLWAIIRFNKKLSLTKHKTNLLSTL